MNKREFALEKIRVEVAQNGKVTREAIRAYIENRVSKEAFNEAVNNGLKQFEGVRK